MRAMNIFIMIHPQFEQSFCLSWILVRTHTQTHTHTHTHTEHDGPVSAVTVSEDGLRVLAGTSAVSQWLNHCHLTLMISNQSSFANQFYSDLKFIPDY